MNLIKKTEDNISDMPQVVCYFTPSTLKFFIMIIFTLGLYEFYWLYKNWNAINKSGIKCNPIMRTLFSHLFIWSLLDNIKKSAKTNLVVKKFPATFLATLYFFLSLMSAFPKLSYIMYLSSIPLIYSNKIAIAINSKQKKFSVDKNFSRWNWVIIIFNGIIFLSAIIGFFI